MQNATNLCKPIRLPKCVRILSSANSSASRSICLWKYIQKKISGGNTSESAKIRRDVNRWRWMTCHDSWKMQASSPGLP